jgi:monovalent cation:H+ antiporter-2, CPA2 family
MVVALVLLPAAASATAAGGTTSVGELALTLAFTFAKVAAFVAIMLVGGRRLIPWLMHYTAHTGSRELFRLAVYAVALGVAYGAAELFGVSFALGAFFAGMVLGESQLSQRAADEAMPLRDAFAVLFFVSVGMLFNPTVLIEAPLAVLATVVVIVFGKSLAAFLIVRAFGYPAGTALTVSASLAQIGEFSFILAGLGVSLRLLPEAGRDLILAGAIVSIMLNPLAFALVARARSRAAARPASAAAAPKPTPHALAPAPATAAATGEEETEAPAVTTLVDHDVVVGYGRVGSLLGAGLLGAGRPVLVFEDRDDEAEAARRSGAEVVPGNAADPEVLAAANLPAARRLFVTIPEAFEAGQVVEQARAANAALVIMARAHSAAAVAHLDGLGATITVMGEREIANRMLENALGASDAKPRRCPSEQAGDQQREERPSTKSSRQAP